MFSDGYNEFSLEEWLRRNEEENDSLDDFDYLEYLDDLKDAWEEEDDYDTGATDIEIP